MPARSVAVIMINSINIWENRPEQVTNVDLDQTDPEYSFMSYISETHT